MWERIRHMLVKEFLQVFRDPRMLIIIFVIPCVQTIVIGYAVTLDVRHVRTAVCDLDNSVDSRDLISRFAGSGYFDVVARPATDDAIAGLLDRGAVSIVLRINAGFAEELRAGRTAALQILVDGTDSNTAGIVLSYASRITGDYSERVLLDRFNRLSGRKRDAMLIALRSRAWFNANLESRNYFVPGVIMVVVTLVTMLLTSMAIVREREVGTMEQVMVSPITPWEFILGKTLPFALIGYVDVIVITVVGVFWFGIPVRGSIPLLLACTGLFLLTSLSAGLFISTISHTQQQAMMSAFFFFFPAMLLSGFSFPIESMPEAIRWLTYLNPLRYFLVCIRGIFLKGVGVEVLWPQMAVLAVMGMALLWAVTTRFRKTLS
jgi:ABC-2 type transport system permease protein